MHKPDANTTPIVTGLRAHGVTVEYITSPFGVAGIPDLLCGYNGRNELLEVKVEKVGLRKKHDPKDDLSAAQIDWFIAWKGETPHVVTNLDEALRVMGVIK